MKIVFLNQDAAKPTGLDAPKHMKSSKMYEYAEPMHL